MAKVEQLKPLELELRKLEDLSESVVIDFARMKEIEQAHRDTNGWSCHVCLGAVVAVVAVLMHAESTNDRILMFSVISMVALFVLAIWQVVYLKKFFRQKKLI